MIQNSIRPEHIRTLCDYFESGSHKFRTIGVRIEQIIVYEDNKEAVPYSGDFGIQYILRELSAFYPEARISRGAPFLGFRTDRFFITLEPGAQLVISINPLEDLSGIRKIYETFRSYLDEVISPFGYECITQGYQPASCVKDIELIPRRRFEYMDRYFKGTGSHGVNMMRGTAATQVSIDYSDETDFLKKIRSLYFLSPYMKLLCDNTLTFEGTPNSSLLTRSHIWDNVDNERCGFIPGVMKHDFSFEKYAEYVLSVPPVYVPKEVNGNEDVYTGSTPACELIGDSALTSEWIDHLLSMVFPDVRLKSFLEFRVADSMPVDRLFGMLALVKGVFYQEELLDYIFDFINKYNIDEAAIRKVTADISEQGWDAKFYNMELKDAHINLMNRAKAALSEEEQSYLTVLPMA